MSSPSDLAILFADVANSTQLYERLGDARAREVVRRCLTLMAEATGRDGGRVVEVVGDEIYAVFPTADCGLTASVSMQEAITGEMVVDRRRVAIHVGLHFGPVLAGADGIPYGDPVNVAHHLVDQAKPGQILASAPVLNACSPQWRQGCRRIDIATLRGRRDPIEAFELLWKAEEATLMRHAPVCGPANGARLLIACGAARAELNSGNPALTIGRGEHNDLVVPEAIVSRLHVRAECRNGRFILTDQSANGTYVQQDGSPVTFVHNQDHVLAGSGMLGLGEMPETRPETTLRYRMEL